MKQTLYSGKSDNCCGYCKLHRRAVTVRQMRTKACLQKQCRHLVKNEDHAYWKMRASIKQKRKARKERIEQYVAAVML